MASPSLAIATPSPSTAPSALDRRLQIVRAMSSEHLGGSSGRSSSNRASSCSPPPSGERRRFPLFPLPPPIDSPVCSLGEASFDDDDELRLDRLSASSHRSAKRVRSFGGCPGNRLSSLLSRQGSFHGAHSPFNARTRADTAPAAFGGGAPATTSTTAASLLTPGRPAPVDVSDSTPISAFSWHRSAPATGDATFRPPPIRTMTSLEGWGGASDDGRASAAAVPFPVWGDADTTAPALRAPPELLRMPSASPTPSSLAGRVAPPPTPRGGRRERLTWASGPPSHAGGASAGAAPPMSLVAPSLYVGDEHAAASAAGLRAAGVTHVLNCASLANPLDGHPLAPPHYLSLGLLDNTSDLPRMQEALGTGVEFITQAIAAGGVVLVHCHRGVSRSATLAIAYLVRATQQPAELIFEQLRTKRRCIDPNLGYWISLKEWERRVLPPALLRSRSSYSSPTPAAAGGSGPRPLSRAG